MKPRRQEDGATLVEAAFALPIFFLLFLGLIDFGLLAFESNKASNAARDGARVGIIDFRNADDVGSADYLAIKSAIEGNLPGRVIPDADLVVNCLTPAGVVIDCDAAEVDVDRISVNVGWERKFISPIANALGFNTAAVSGEARMTIVGSPVGGSATPPPACEVSSVAVSPDPVDRFDSGPDAGRLQEDLTVTVTGTGSCSDETLTLVAPDGSTNEICSSGCLGSTTYVGTTDAFWMAGDARAEMVNGDGSIVSDTFEVRDPVAPATCQLTDLLVSPDPVSRVTSGVNAGQLASNLRIELVGTEPCTALTVTLVTPAGNATELCSPGQACLGVFSYGAGEDDSWTSGTARVEVSGEQTMTRQFTVTDQPACAVDILVANDPASVDKQGRLSNFDGNTRQRVTVSPTSGSGPCPELVVTMTPPSGEDPVVLCNTGPCTGAFDYVTGDGIWAPPSEAETTATVDVNGSGFVATATFEVDQE